MRTNLLTTIRSLSRRAKVGILVLFSLTAGVVATFELGGILFQGFGLLPHAQSPSLSVFYQQKEIVLGRDGYQVEILENLPVRLQIRSKSEQPTLIESIFLLPTSPETWEPLTVKVEQPAHGSISMDSYVIKPTADKRIEIFQVVDQLITVVDGNNLLPRNTIRTVSSDINDLILLEVRVANQDYASFCGTLDIQFRFETGGSKIVSNRICFLKNE